MNQFDYSQYTNDAQITAQESYRIKDGAGGKSIFDPNKIVDIPRFKPSLGVKVIDVIMARAGANHPLVVSGKLREDQHTHICWVYVHKGIGPNQDWFVCPARTYGKPCPCCEHRNRLMADPDITTEAANVFGTGKHPIGIYNIIHHLNPNQITWQEQAMIWDINNAFMESKLQSIAKQPMITDEAPTGYINYMWPTAGPQGGRHISFEVVQKGQFFDYTGHKFFPRREPIPPHVLQQGRCLSELLYVPTYDEIKDVLEAGMNQPIGGEPTGQAYQPPSYGQPVFGMPEPKCPFAEYGGKLGESIDTWEECRTCTMRVQCEAARPAPVTQPEPVIAQPTQPVEAINPMPSHGPQPMTTTQPASQPTPAAAVRQAPIPRRPQK